MFELREALPEARGVLLRDREDTDAALRTAGTAEEMVTSAPVGVGHNDVDDLEESWDGALQTTLKV